MKINITKVKKSRVNEVDMKNLNFGEVFSDHMLIIDYTDGKWQTPQILPYRRYLFSAFNLRYPLRPGDF